MKHSNFNGEWYHIRYSTEVLTKQDNRPNKTTYFRNLKKVLNARGMTVKNQKRFLLVPLFNEAVALPRVSSRTAVISFMDTIARQEQLSFFQNHGLSTKMEALSFFVACKLTKLLAKHDISTKLPRVGRLKLAGQRSEIGVRGVLCANDY